MHWLLLYSLVALAALYARWLCAVLWAKAMRHPPLETGLLPLVGATLQFARHMPLRFVQMCRERLGDTFTIEVGGRMMTFLFDPETFPLFFHRGHQDGSVSFSEATLPFLDRGFGVVPDDYFARHHFVLQGIREKLCPRELERQFCEAVAAKQAEFFEHEWRFRAAETDVECDLMRDVVRCGVFWSSVSVFFGDRAANLDGLMDDLVAFDSQFETALAPFPLLSWIMPDFVRAKESLRSSLARIVQTNKATLRGADHAKLLSTCVLDKVDACPDAADVSRAAAAKSRPGWLLSTLWASEANAIPSTFWSICYLLSHPSALQRARDEVDRCAAELGPDFSWMHFQELKYLQNCVSESFRLRATGTIVRKTTRTIKVKDFVVPKGHYLCLSPQLVHRQDKYFPNANEFRPERWDPTHKEYVKPTPNSFISFGGGLYRCPGQNFARMEITLFIARLLLLFDMSFHPSHPKMPEARQDKLVGIQHPVRDCHVVLQRRSRLQ